MLFANARILGEVAGLLGNPDDARRFANLAAKVRGNYNRAYLDSATGKVATGSQAAQAVSLHFGLAPPPAQHAVLAHLIADLERTGNRQTTGEVCFRSLLQSLAGAGRHDLIFAMINRTDAPGYGCLLAQGLTTLSERWDRPGSSLNHCMFGHIQEWFQAHLLGIRQAGDSVAFRKIIIAPQPVGDVAWARGHYDSVRGRIAVAWKREAESFQLEVTVPGNTAAEVQVPAPAPGRVLESGQPAARAPGVKFLGHADGRARYEVGSGRYVFAVRAGS
jgi:hypothetical protein